MMNTERRVIVACLIGVAVSLLLVGVVSGTLIRHIVQVIPLALAVIPVARCRSWGAYAALPLFLFWMVIMILIWLFLLGVSNIASGRFTVIEVILTVVMAVLSVAGLWAGRRAGRSAGRSAAVMAFLCFAALQFAAMWASFQSPLRNR